MKDQIDARPLNEFIQEIQVPHVTLDGLDVLKGSRQAEKTIMRKHTIKNVYIRAPLQQFNTEM
jgi:hypothetical protein